MNKQIALILTAFVMSGCVSNETKEDGWVCDAKNIQTGSYSGGTHAYIHLFGYSNGNNYPVEKVSDNEVKGKTGDNTPFTCKKM